MTPPDDKTAAAIRERDRYRRRCHQLIEQIASQRYGTKLLRLSMEMLEVYIGYKARRETHAAKTFIHLDECYCWMAIACENIPFQRLFILQ
ncbi:hypothetical protein [Coleofasciculus sp. FACHB-501]|uniref:hypothetical protein n=1 Tax=Cyanophyceae TaxID=3028117 RepID=UPI001682B909|nr:hypothetical protein [Coleofasciculus sp. FACHB-501]MBD1837219.1 hypothetical protein [Coleofasciculus sp. FACHB-501]